MAQKDITGWAGWAGFAGILMLLVGAFQAILGLVALLNDTFYVVGKEGLLVFDYTTWGWAHLLFGLFLFLAGMSVLKGHAFGRVIGIILAFLSAVANLAFIPAYPIWSVIVIAIDVLVIYGLAVHGNELAE